MPKLSTYSPLSSGTLLGSKEFFPFITVGPVGSFSDYICTGTADDVQMNLALLNGGDIFVRKGAYSLSAKLIIPSNTRLVFDKGATVTLANGSNSNMIENSDQVGGNTDITIDGLVLDGNKSNQSSGGRGIYFVNVTRPKVKNSYIHDCRNRAIHYVNCMKGRIADTEGVNCGIFQEQTFTFESCNKCIYSDCFASGGQDRDFEIAFCTNCELHNCVSDSPVGAGLAIYSTTATLNSGIIIDGLIILNPLSEGIYLERVTNSFFSNIWIYNAGDDAIRDFGTVSLMADNEFSNVFIYNPGASGIVLDGPRTVFNNIKVYNAGGYGIRLLSSECRLSTCHVYGAGNDCFWIGPSANNTGISNCLGKNGGKNAVSNHKNGLRVDALDCQITGSNFFDDQGSPTQDYGIREISPADRNIYLGVSARGNNVSGITTVGANSIAPPGSNITS